MFWTRLRQAAEDGVLLAVKWGVVVIVLGFLGLWALGDYTLVRQRAYNGQIAFEAIQQAQQRQSGMTTSPTPPKGSEK